MSSFASRVVRAFRVRVKELLLVSLVALGLVLVANSPGLPKGIADSDFRAYWSSAYLLSKGENFVDSQTLFLVEKEQTSWEGNYTVGVWNPPWLSALLLPYALLPFRSALLLWVVTSIGLIFLAAIAIWNASAHNEATLRRTWIALVVAFAFSPTLLALKYGQVNTLVLVSLAGFAFFYKRRKDITAGAFLAFGMVKPHLAYITLPILLLDLLRAKSWRSLTSFFTVLLLLSVIVWLKRPTFLSEYSIAFTRGNLLNYETPTLGGAWNTFFGWPWFQLSALAILPASLLCWWLRGKKFDLTLKIDLSLMLSLFTAPFGWSYDTILLLFPIIHVMLWICERFRGNLARVTLALLLGSIYAAAYIERWFGVSEVYFWWITPAVALVYLLALSHQPRQSMAAPGGGEMGADLADCDKIQTPHLAEAIHYRPRGQG